MIRNFDVGLVQGQWVQHTFKDLIPILVLITSASKGQSILLTNYHLGNFDSHSSGNIRKCANSASDATLLRQTRKIRWSASVLKIAYLPSLPLAKSTTIFWLLQLIIFVYAWPEQTHWLTDRIYAFVIGQNSHCYVMSGIGGKEKCWPYNRSEKGHPVRAFNIITLSWLTKGIDTGVQLAESKCYQWSIREPLQFRLETSWTYMFYWYSRTCP